MQQLSNRFQRLTDAAFQVKANIILDGLTGNSYFPNPKPSLADVTTARNAYKEALLEAQTGNRVAILTKKTCRNQLTLLLQQLGQYVLSEAGENREMLASSGFTPARQRQASAITEKPASPILSDGQNTGELAIRIRRVPGARCYLYQYTPDPLPPADTAWQQQASTLVKHVFKGLQSGSRYWVRVYVIGTREQVYSNVVSRVVQ